MDQESTQLQPVPEVTPIPPQQPPTNSSPLKHHKIINAVLAAILVILIASSLVAYLLFFPKKSKTIPDQCPVKISPCPSSTISQKTVKELPGTKMPTLTYQNIPGDTKIVAVTNGIFTATESTIVKGKIRISLNDTHNHTIIYSFYGTTDPKFNNIFSKDVFYKIEKGSVIGITTKDQNHQLDIIIYTGVINGVAQFMQPVVNADKTLKPPTN